MMETEWRRRPDASALSQVQQRVAEAFSGMVIMATAILALRSPTLLCGGSVVMAGEWFILLSWTGGGLQTVIEGFNRPVHVAVMLNYRLQQSV